MKISPIIEHTRARRAAVALVLLLAAFWLGWPLITLGALTHGTWYSSNDGMNYPYLLAHFQDAFGQGILYPRWMPNMLGGYGYPSFVFYQPGFFYFAMPFSALLSDPVSGVAAAALAAIWLGGLGAYRLARQWNTPAFSLACALLFMLAPYGGIDLFTRGDFTEYLGTQLCPWVLYFALRLMARVRAGKPVEKALCALVISATLLIYTHPLVAMFFLPFAAAAMLAAGERAKPSAEALWVGGSALVMAVVLSAPFWFTTLQLKHAVNYRNFIAGGYNPVHNLQPLTLGFLHQNWQALPVLAVFAAARRNRFAALAAGFTVGYLFLLTPLARPVWQAGLPVLQYVQFPSRLKGPLMVIALLGIAQAGKPLRQWRGLPPAGMLALAVAFMAVAVGLALGPWRMGRQLPATDYHAMVASLDSKPGQLPHFAAYWYNPNAMRPAGLKNRLAANIPIVQMAPWAKDKGEVTLLPGASPYQALADIHITSVPAAAFVNQFAFPGWRLRVNGQDVVPQPGANGRVRAWFAAPGNYHLRAWYEGPPRWRLRNFIMLLCMLLLYGGVYWRRAVLARLCKTP